MNKKTFYYFSFLIGSFLTIKSMDISQILNETDEVKPLEYYSDIVKFKIKQSEINEELEIQQCPHCGKQVDCNRQTFGRHVIKKLCIQRTCHLCLAVFPFDQTKISNLAAQEASQKLFEHIRKEHFEPYTLFPNGKFICTCCCSTFKTEESCKRHIMENCKSLPSSITNNQEKQFDIKKEIEKRFNMSFYSYLSMTTQINKHNK